MHPWHTGQRTVCSILMLLGISATPGLGAELFPLEAGRIWEFADGARRVVISADAPDAHGVTAITEESDLSGLTRSWHWRRDPAGAIWLLGFEDSGEMFTYQPALLWLPVDVDKGASWSNRSSLLNSGGKPVLEIVQNWTSAGWEALEFPWGDVQAVRIELVGDHPGLGFAGREGTDPGPEVFVQYYAEDLGIVRRGGNWPGLVDVESFGSGFVSVDNQSFGAFKATH